MKPPLPPKFEIFDTAPETLRVFVDYYNSEHKAKLNSGSYPPVVRSIAGTTIEIPTADFLAYYLFWKQRQKPSLYSRLAMVRTNNLYEAAGELNNLVTFRNRTISSEQGIEEGNNAVTGRIGEAVALCVLNQIHDTGPGDWIALPEKRNQIPKGLRPMDYRILTASDGKEVVQVEAKGSYLARLIDKNSPLIKQHASGIEKKKRTHLDVPEASSGIWQADLRYGTITAFGGSGGADAHCWLLDPPADPGGDPATVRTISRLLYACNLLQLVAPRADLTIALVNRISSLLSEEHVANSAKRPLLRANGQPYSDLFKETAFEGNCKSRFFATRTKVEDYPAGGVVIGMPNQQFLFIGVREDLIAHAALQDFEAIQDFSVKPQVFQATINAVIPTGEAISMGLTSERRATPGLYQLRSFNGRLFASSSGLLFGTLLPAS